jgi:hypothetical protein
LFELLVWYLHAVSKFEMATAYSGKHNQWRAIQSSRICLVVLLMGSRLPLTHPVVTYGHTKRGQKAVIMALKPLKLVSKLQPSIIETPAVCFATLL